MHVFCAGSRWVIGCATCRPAGSGAGAGTTRSDLGATCFGAERPLFAVSDPRSDLERPVLVRSRTQ